MAEVEEIDTYCILGMVGQLKGAFVSETTSRSPSMFSLVQPDDLAYRSANRKTLAPVTSNPGD